MTILELKKINKKTTNSEEILFYGNWKADLISFFFLLHSQKALFKLKPIISKFTFLSLLFPLNEFRMLQDRRVWRLILLWQEVGNWDGSVNNLTILCFFKAAVGERISFYQCTVISLNSTCSFLFSFLLYFKPHLTFVAIAGMGSRALLSSDVWDEGEFLPHTELVKWVLICLLGRGQCQVTSLWKCKLVEYFSSNSYVLFDKIVLWAHFLFPLTSC